MEHVPKEWTVKEQIIEEPALGMTIQFEVMPDGKPRLRFFGENMPYGNREIVFDGCGVEAGGGTFTAGLCKPTWNTPID